MKRKVIQIAVTPDSDPRNFSAPGPQLFCLADDGTIWEKDLYSNAPWFSKVDTSFIEEAP